MLSPRYLEGISDEIVDIYAQLEADILQDMARRIARLGKVTEATKWQAELLAETGALKKDVNKIIKKYDPAIRKEITAIYNDAMVKNARADNIIFKDALGHGVSDINAQVMLASIQKTRADLSRLTITTAYTTEQQFVSVANAAYMQVVTGAFDYDTAMKKACNQLATEGVSGVQYRNGKPVRLNIEPAVRMNIITGVNQTASAMTLNNCDELGCDLVETTAHIGARPEHAAWQGEVFSISGTNPKYRPFSVCELGTITGLCGINCRHSYYPYFEGTETHYTQADLDEMEKQTVTYNGQKMTRYEAEEELRGIERNIRHYKRRALTQEAAGIDNTAAREKIGEWQAKARDFTKQTHIERDTAREFIGTKDGKQPTALKPPKVTTATLEANKEYKELLKKYGDRETMLQKATKREIQTVHIHDMSNAQPLPDYQKLFNSQYVDTNVLTQIMQNGTTIDQRDAIREWTGSAYRTINAYYRTGAAVDEGYKRTGQIIHDYLNTCEYPQMYVRRGADYEYINKLYGSDKWKKDPGLLLNNRLTDKGFLATTPDKGGGFSGQVMLYYKTPTKGKGAYIASLSHYSHEKETLFINGTSAIIKEIRTEVLGGRVRYNIYLDME
jgi:hypothetical protein